MTPNNKMKIGLKIYSNTVWMGGVNYVTNWIKTLHCLPEPEKQEVYLIYQNQHGSYDKEAVKIAQAHRHLVKEVRPLTDVPKLGLDFFYPVTNIFEAPFGAPWAGWIPDWQCKYLPEMFDPFELSRRDYHYRLLAQHAPSLAVSSQMAYDDTQRLVGDTHVPMQKLHFPSVMNLPPPGR